MGAGAGGTGWGVAELVFNRDRVSFLLGEESSGGDGGEGLHKDANGLNAPIHRACSDEGLRR